MTQEPASSNPAPTSQSKKSLGRTIAIALGVLLVLVVLAFLILLPIVKKKNQALARLDAKSRAGVLASAVQRQTKDFGGLLPFNVVNKEDGKTLLSWRCILLPYAGDQHIAGHIDSSVAWDEQTQVITGSITAPQHPVGSFKSPRSADQSSPSTHFVAVTDKGSAMAGERIRMEDIESRDGKASTALFFEFPASTINWAEPRDVSLQEAIKIIQTAEDGTAVALADGNAIVVPKTATTDDLTKLFLLDNGAPAEKW